MQGILKFNGLNDYIFKELFTKKSILVKYINILLDLNVTEDEIVYHHSELQTDIEAKEEVLTQRRKIKLLVKLII